MAMCEDYDVVQAGIRVQWLVVIGGDGKVLEVVAQVDESAVLVSSIGLIAARVCEDEYWSCWWKFDIDEWSLAVGIVLLDEERRAVELDGGE